MTPQIVTGSESVYQFLLKTTGVAPLLTDIPWPRDASVFNPHTKTHLISAVPNRVDRQRLSTILLNFVPPVSKSWKRHVAICKIATCTTEEAKDAFESFLRNHSQQVKTIASYLEGGNVIWAGKKALVGYHSVILTAHMQKHRGIIPPNLPSNAPISDEAYWAAYIKENGLIYDGVIFCTKETEITLPSGWDFYQRQRLKPAARVWQAYLNAAERKIQGDLEAEEIAFLHQNTFHIDLAYLPVRKQVFMGTYGRIERMIRALIKKGELTVSPMTRKLYPTPQAGSIALTLASNGGVVEEARACYHLFNELEKANIKALQGIGLLPRPVAGMFPFWSDKKYHIISPLNGLTGICSGIVLNQNYTNPEEEKLSHLTANELKGYLNSKNPVLFFDQEEGGVWHLGGLRCLTNELAPYPIAN